MSTICCVAFNLMYRRPCPPLWTLCASSLLSPAQACNLSDHHPQNMPQPSVRSLYRNLYVCVLWARVVAALPQTANDNNAIAASSTNSHVALIPSAPRPTLLIPPDTLKLQSSTPSHTDMMPSQPAPPVLGSSQPPTFILSSHAEPPSTPPPSTTRPPGIIPSRPPSIPSTPPPPGNPNNPGTISSSDKDQPTGIGFPNGTAPVPKPTSTDEGLKPIPAPSTEPGSPDGHHEIPEPNLTGPCRNCNPAQQSPVTGWSDDQPTSSPHAIAEPQESPVQPKGPPPQATITVGSSSIVIKPLQTVQSEPSGGGNGGSGGGGSGGGGGEPGGESQGNSNSNDVKFVIGDLMTVQPSQTVTIENTPVVIQTNAGRTEVIVSGTKTIPFESPAQAHITNPPLVPLPVTVGSQTLLPIATTNKNSDDQIPKGYIVQGQTLVAGGPPITVQGTVYSLPASPTAIVVNGQTSTITPGYGAVISTTTIPLLTLFQSTFTANAAGNYVIAPGTTLRPGGEAITVSGTVISLKPGNTEVVVQGSTSRMAPATTVVTVTRSVGSGGGGGSAGNNGGKSGPSGTAAAMLPYPAGVGRTRSLTMSLDGPVEGAAILGFLVVGWLAVWL